VTVAVVWRVRDQAERVLRERRNFRERLQALPAPRCDIDAAELIYGELVANTIRYANGAVEARLELGPRGRVLVVRDYGPGLRVVPWTPRRDPYAESGRGLAIVEMLASDVDVESAEGGGTVVRAVLPNAETPAA
jgi:anti-sigma regulatory factor (Ser/Thr protein kinase)